jgi:hypothetical protein
MPESGPFGFVRGALSNERPYRDPGLRDRGRYFLGYRGSDDRVALGIERYKGDRLPVASLSSPAPGIGFTSPDVKLVSSGAYSTRS